MTKFRKRPAIWIAEGTLAAGLMIALIHGNQEIALAIVVAIGSTMSKMVESEEKGEPHGGEQ